MIEFKLSFLDYNSYRIPPSPSILKFPKFMKLSYCQEYMSKLTNNAESWFLMLLLSGL